MAGTSNTEFKILTDAKPMTGAEMREYQMLQDAIDAQIDHVYEPMFPRSVTPEGATVVDQSPARGQIVAFPAGRLSVRNAGIDSGSFSPEAS